jgi:hypothetical protein
MLLILWLVDRDDVCSRHRSNSSMITMYTLTGGEGLTDVSIASLLLRRSG